MKQFTTEQHPILYSEESMHKAANITEEDIKQVNDWIYKVLMKHIEGDNNVMGIVNDMEVKMLTDPKYMRIMTLNAVISALTHLTIHSELQEAKVSNDNMEKLLNSILKREKDTKDPSAN